MTSPQAAPTGTSRKDEHLGSIVTWPKVPTQVLFFGEQWGGFSVEEQQGWDSWEWVSPDQEGLSQSWPVPCREAKSCKHKQFSKGKK